MNDIFDLIPKDKFDNSNMEILKTINADEVKPILGKLLEWLQDLNWPVAMELIRILPRFHFNLIPHIKAVFDSDDDVWKCRTLCLIKDFPPETLKLLAPEIKRMAEFPTTGEIEEGANEYAVEIIQMANSIA